MTVLSTCAACGLFCNTASAYVISDLTSPGRWTEPCHYDTLRVCVSWSLMGRGPVIVETTPGGNRRSMSSIPLSEFMPDGYLGQIEAAFAAWSAVTNIDFLQVEDDPSQDFNAPGHSGDIRIGGHAPLAGLAHGYFPPVNGISAAGDIHFDSGVTWSLYDPEPGYTIFRVATHEIGHALGLHHQPAGITALMNRVYTEDTPLGLLADDIAGAQYLYGPRWSPAGVPEPSTPVFLGIGLLSLLFGRVIPAGIGVANPALFRSRNRKRRVTASFDCDPLFRRRLPASTAVASPLQ